MTYLATQWQPNIYEAETFILDDARWSVSADQPYSFRTQDGNSFRFEVRKGDQYSSRSWTDPIGNERAEAGESYHHPLGEIGYHFAASYDFMMEPGAQNTSPWLVTGQFFSGGRTPPFEIKFMGDDRMAVVVKEGGPAGVTEHEIYHDASGIQRGSWYNIKIDLKLDPFGSNGHAYVWRDGSLIAQYTGKLGYTDASDGEWWMGAYRKTPPGGESVAVNYKNVHLTYGEGAHTDPSKASSVIEPSSAPTVSSDQLSAPPPANIENQVNGPSNGDTWDVGKGPDSLVIKFSQDAYQGDAQFTVAVDGSQIPQTFTANASHVSGESDVLTLRGNWGSGNHTVHLNFLNDAWGGTPSTDRNLYVDQVSYNSEDVQGAAAPLYWGGDYALTFDGGSSGHQDHHWNLLS